MITVNVLSYNFSQSHSAVLVTFPFNTARTDLYLGRSWKQVFDKSSPLWLHRLLELLRSVCWNLVVQFVGIFEIGCCKSPYHHSWEFGTAASCGLERNCSVERRREAGNNSSGDCRSIDTRLSGPNVCIPWLSQVNNNDTHTHTHTHTDLMATFCVNLC